MQSYTPPPLWGFAPFVLLLLAIAVLPLTPKFSHWWEKNRNKLLLSLVFALAMSVLQSFDLFIESWTPEIGHTTPVAIRSSVCAQLAGVLGMARGFGGGAAGAAKAETEIASKDANNKLRGMPILGACLAPGLNIS